MGIVLGSSFITTMSQFDSYVCDPQTEDLIPADLDELLQDIYDQWDYESLDEIPPADEDRDLLDYDNWEVI